jgi:orotate phosphoribosyltransferase
MTHAQGAAMAAAATAARVERIFSDAGAYRQGHFKLKSGRHADRYVEKFQVLQWPAQVEVLCGLLAERGRAAARALGAEIGVVVGPTTGGVILAYETARQLGVRGIFAEQELDADGNKVRVLRRGFRIEPGELVLLVDDVVTTGASLTEMLPLIEASGGRLVGAEVLVDRTGTLESVSSPVSGQVYPAQALWTLNLPSYEPGPQTCPQCAAGLQLEAPGSSGLASG